MTKFNKKITALIGYSLILSIVLLLFSCTLEPEKNLTITTTKAPNVTTIITSTTTPTSSPVIEIITPFLKTTLVEFNQNALAPMNEFYQQTINPGKFVAEDDLFIFYLKNGNVYSFDKILKNSKLIYSSTSNVIGLNVYKDRVYFLDAFDQIYSLLSINKDGTDLNVEVTPASNKLYFEANYAYFGHDGKLAQYNLDTKIIENNFPISNFEYLVKIENKFYYYNTNDFILKSFDLESNKGQNYEIEVSQYFKVFKGNLYFSKFNKETMLHDIHYLDGNGAPVLFYKHQGNWPIIDYLITDQYLYYISYEFIGGERYLYRFDLQTNELVIMNKLEHGDIIQVANGYFLIASTSAFDILDRNGNKVNIDL